ncbi:glycosyltransferase family 4 protein [bacterium]|nr:glycosyltransferase family 4 protein [bacterium]
MKVGIYAPYLETCGGGEKYICKIAEILSKDNNVEFIVFKNLPREDLESKLKVNLNRVSIKRLNIPRLIKKTRYLRGMTKVYMISKITKDYDLFINQEHFSCIPSLAKRSILVCEVPPTKFNTRLTNNVVTRLIFDPKLKTYDMIIVNSFYTKKWVEEYYGQKNRNVEVLYPPVEQFSPLPKENIILSVGRFFTGGHCKKQLEMIKAFKGLYDKSNIMKGWEYHLVGGVSTNIGDLKYLKRCQKEAQGYPIYFHINVSFDVLKTLYGKAKIFWHATGLGEDETKCPERMEHFGITTVEAMSAGCVPIVINKGGQSEIVRNKMDGFLYNNVKELKECTLKLVDDEILLRKMSKRTVARSKEFDIEKFNKRVTQIFGRLYRLY